MDRLILDIKNFIEAKRLIEPGDGVVIGLSGGPDSVFLLYVLHALQDHIPCTLRALHVHHGIRGAEADRDARFSEELCRTLGIPFRIIRVQAPAYAAQHGQSLEEAARILRYEALEEVRQELEAALRREAAERPGVALAERPSAACAGRCGNAEKGRWPNAWISVAHHLDDQAETVLHHLVRGSGLRGLAGMEPRRDHVIRPLLYTKREDILKWLAGKNVHYVTDSTNEDQKYTRNRLRGCVLPALKSINPEAAEHIASAAELVREADDFFRESAVRFAEHHAVLTGPLQGAGAAEMLPVQDAHAVLPVPSGEAACLRAISLDTRELRTCPPLLRRYVYMELIRRMDVPLKDWGAVHFDALDRLVFGPGGGHLDLPCRMSADYRKKHLILRQNRDVLSMKRRKNHG